MRCSKRMYFSHYYFLLNNTLYLLSAAPPFFTLPSRINNLYVFRIAVLKTLEFELLDFVMIITPSLMINILRSLWLSIDTISALLYLV
mgnify:CR=1 FL=1